ncbi:flagellar filament capping protein FliD [Viridibacillus arvi]|uniref:flagellar filament capping protein FliD n=1 Tax=Viridibacillus arvi TaxID=263475 RepID=UPI00187BA16E|nr:flagellar filament capping protein FliD [Viridibacillus sp. JNUCC-6]QOV10525.1 flagellar filament capping protein FliD [Viridibacillus sp. JNUCC-6]
MVNRVGGLASGMDIDALVEKLMTAERVPLNKLNQQKTIYEWQRDAYRGINTKLKTFSDYLFDNFSLSSNFVKNKVNVSNSTAISVSAGSGASGVLNIQQVKSLATAASKTVDIAPKTTKSVMTGNTKLSEIDPGLPLNGNGEYQLDLVLTKKDELDLPKSITVDGTATVDELLEKLNKNGLKASITDGKFSITAEDKDTKVVAATGSQGTLKALGFTAAEDGKELGTSKKMYVTGGGTSATKNTTLGELGLSDGTLMLSVINAKGEQSENPISYKADDTIESFMKKLNSAGLTGIVTPDGKMSITANATGEGEIRVVSDKDADGKDKVSGVMQTLKFAENGVIANNGTNANYTVNGLPMSSSSNTFTLSGYTVTLKQLYNESLDLNKPTDLGQANASAISVAADKDVDSMVDKVKEFVSKYNELISGINDQLKETKYRSYTPLTSEQRKDMTESEQKLWDEKAMSGLLRGDSILRSGLGDMRNVMYSQVNGLGEKVIDTMFEMGITTSGTVSEGGKLVIDETKLRKALEEDPDRVVKTLTQTGSKTGDDGDTRGIVQRLRDSMGDFTKNIEKKAGRSTMTDSQYTIGKSLKSTEDRITSLTARLKDVEARYWKQFSAMEQAINKANSQSSIFAQFGGQ